MTVTLYGIPNCDTVRKARNWLDARGVAYAFHDYKQAGADPTRLSDWADVAGWEKLLNRTGSTFRKLADSDKMAIDRTKAIVLMAAQPSLIKRPVVEHPGGLLVGFDPAGWNAAFA